MDVREAQQLYLSLQYRCRVKEITEDQFKEEVQQLRVQAPDGAWWQLIYDGTGWLRWNGSAWEKTLLPPSMKGSPAAAGRSSGPGNEGAPPSLQNLKQYLAFLFGEMKKNLLRKISLVLIVFSVVWAINTYLAMRFQIPWWGQSGEFFANMLAARESLLWRFLLWFLLSAVLTGIFLRLRRDGFQQFSRELGRLPLLFRNVWHFPGQAAVPLLLGSAAAGLLLCTLANIRFFSLLLFLAVLLSLSRGSKSDLLLLSRLCWSDLGQLLHRDLQGLADDQALLLFCGFALGALLVFILPLLPQSGYYIFLLLVVLAIVFNVLKKKDMARQL